LHELIHMASHGLSAPNARLRLFAGAVLALRDAAQRLADRENSTLAERRAAFRTLRDQLAAFSVPDAPDEPGSDI